MILALGGALIFGPGCAYYNTFYFAKKYYSQAEQAVQKSQGDRLPPDALKKYDDSIKQCSKVLQFHGGSRWIDDAIFLMGACYYGKKEYETALRKFDELQANYQDSKLIPRALYLSGLCHYRRRGFEEMEKSFQRVLEISPKFGQRDEIFSTRARAAEDRGEKREAIRRYQTLIRQFPKSPRAEEARLRIGDLYFDVGRADSAYASYDDLVRSARTDKVFQDAQVKAADALVRMGRAEDAIRSLEKLVPHDEQQQQRAGGDSWPVRVRLHLASAYNATKQPFRAIEVLKTATERYPASTDAPEAQFQIGYTYEVYLDSLKAARKAYDEMSKFAAQSAFREQGQTRARNLDQLQTLSSQASGDSASSREGKAAAQLKIAEVYLFSQDRVAEALKQYREVVRQFPESPQAARAAYAVGWIHLNKQEGSRDSAVVELTRLVHDYPSSRQARRALDLLASAGADTSGLKSLLVEVQPDTVAAPPPDSTASGAPAAPSQSPEGAAGPALPDSTRPSEALPPEALGHPPQSEPPDSLLRRSPPGASDSPDKAPPDSSRKPPPDTLRRPPKDK